MAKENHHHVRKMSGALMLGLISGAVIGLLSAPKKGEELRKEIGQKLEDWMIKLEDEKEDLEAKLKRIFGVVTKETTEMYGRVKAEVLATVATQGKKLKPGEYEKVVDKLVKKSQKKFKLAKDVAHRLKDDIMDSLSRENKN